MQADYGGRETLMKAPENLIQLAESTLQCIPGDWLFARVDIIDWQKAPVVSELELIEPDLFLTLDSDAPRKFARATAEKLSRLP